MEKKVGIVLVNYNGRAYIRDCMDSLLRQTYKNVEILFWDNASADGSVAFVKENYPNIHIEESRINYGFAGANNRAAKLLLKTGADYILLLNVDTEADSRLIERLLEKADERTVTTARIYMSREGRDIWYAGGQLQLDKGKSEHCLVGGRDAVKVSFISGCCMMIHRDIIMRCGLFDPAYYLYYEDTDLCMRWYLHHIDMCYVPQAELWHKVGGSSGGIKNPMKEYYMVRNRLYFIHKYWQVMKKNALSILLELVREEWDSLLENNWRIRKARYLAYLDFIRSKRGKANHQF